jgi:glutamate synthase domain-containing protein 1
MCGIIGLMLKSNAQRGDLGRLVQPMFDCMAERGPDSAGLAIFSTPVANGRRRYDLLAAAEDYDWFALHGRIEEELHHGGEIAPLADHAVLTTDIAPHAMREWLAARAPELTLLSVGRSMDVYKNAGNPRMLARRYHFAELSGSHCVGHTRMATESRVSPVHSHPFTAGEDFCLVHNGSLSNYHQLRRMLEAEGVSFETDNDSETACRFLQWRMDGGETLDDALRGAFSQLDGFYTLLMGTADGMTLVRDGFACKPAVVAETDSYVAVSSEFRSLAHLPGIANANLFEPLPEAIYTWKVAP